MSSPSLIATPHRRSRAAWTPFLDLADQIQGRSQSGFAFLPLGRADFARVSGDVLGSLDLAQQVGSVPADAFGGDFHSLDDAFRVNDESTAVGQALVFTQDCEAAADPHGRVAEHGVLDLADERGAVGPGLVGEAGVGRDGVNFYAHLLQLGIVVSHVAQFGRAYEGEVSRVEEEYGPLALHVSFGNFDELALLEGLGFERLDLSIDNGHLLTPWGFRCLKFTRAILADQSTSTNLLNKCYR